MNSHTAIIGNNLENNRYSTIMPEKVAAVIANSIQVGTYTPDAALKKAVSTMESYVRAHLGDVRTSSLDSPKSRAPRIAALRGG